MSRVVVIGLDGGTEAVIEAAGPSLPHLRAMRRDGASCVLRSTIPPITAAAWPSMFTGWNPGRHGMFDFRPLDITRPAGIFGAGNPSGFDGTSRFAGSAGWRGHAVWDLANVPCAITGVPMTYPPWPVNGRMTAGFPLPDYARNHSLPAADAGHPPLLEDADRLAAMTDERLARHCLQLIERQAAVVRGQLADAGVRLIVAVFQATDFAQHRLWKYLDLPAHPLRDALLEMYRTIDRVIGEAMAAVGAEGAVLVVSDHGFGPHPRTLVATDAVLAAAGLLAPARLRRVDGVRASLSRSAHLRRAARSAAIRRPRLASALARAEAAGQAIDRERTQAHRYPLYGPAEGVVVNLRGRTPHGVVAVGTDYERVRDRVIEALSALTDAGGGRPVEWVGRREEVFQGDRAESAPDVIALFAGDRKPVSGLGPVFQPAPQTLLDRHSGVHTMDGVLVAAGAGVPAGVHLGRRSVVDVAPTVLGLLGFDSPEPCDGRDLFPHSGRRSTPASLDAPAGALSADALAADEVSAIERSLRSLGYLE